MAKVYRERTANQSAVGEQLVRWRSDLEAGWSDLRFGEMKVKRDKEKHFFEVEVYLGKLEANMIRVELYADGVNGEGPDRHEMRGRPKPVGLNGFLYTAEVPAIRPATDYTARVIPYHGAALLPLEAPLILWQR